MCQQNKDGAKSRLLSVYVNDLKMKNNAEMKRHFSTHTSMLWGKRIISIDRASLRLQNAKLIFSTSNQGATLIC